MKLRSNKTIFAEVKVERSSVLEHEEFTDSKVCVSQGSTRKFVGVSKVKSGYVARVKHPVSKKQLWLGTFKSAEEASMVCSEKRKELEREVEGMKRVEGGVCDEEIKKAGDGLDGLDGCLGEKRGHGVFCDEEIKKVGDELDGCLGEKIVEGVVCNEEIKKDVDQLDETCLENQESSLEIDARKSRIAEKKRRKIGRVIRSKSGNFGARITHPVSKKQIWLGTFGSAEEASIACLAKEAELKGLDGEKGNQGVVCDEAIKVEDDIEPLQINARISKKKKKKKKNQDASLKIDSRKSKISKKKKSSHVSERVAVGFIGVSQAKNGKYVARISNPISKKKIWLGTFGTAEEASMVYMKKKAEFEIEVQCNKSTDHLGPILEETNHNICLENQDSAMKVEPIDHSFNGGSGPRMEDLPIQKNVVSGERQLYVNLEPGAKILLRTESGVPLMDSHGFLLGRWSWIDDLSLPIV